MQNMLKYNYKVNVKNIKSKNLNATNKNTYYYFFKNFYLEKTLFFSKTEKTKVSC